MKVLDIVMAVLPRKRPRRTNDTLVMPLAKTAFAPPCRKPYP